MSINNVLKEYDDMKEELKDLNQIFYNQILPIRYFMLFIKKVILWFEV